ncbi:MAG: FHA domain-containing protein [Rhodothermales bacterium]
MPGLERAFTEAFTIGRGIQATLHVDSGRVSRIHAEVLLEDSQWVLRDAGSTNGTYCDGERIDEMPLAGEIVVRLGRDGPAVHFKVQDRAPVRESAETAVTEEAPIEILEEKAEADRIGRRTSPDRGWMGAGVPEELAPSVPSAGASAPQQNGGPASSKAKDPKASVSQVIRRYFEEGADGPVGERTMMIRQAYQQVQTKQKRAYGGIIGGVAVLLILALAFAIWQQIRVERLEGTAESLFYEMKEQDLETAQLRLLAEEGGNADLAAQLDNIEARRLRKAELYEGYIEELGLYRKLSPQEREIYRVARIFNESEFTMPAGFVREIKGVITEWQSSGRFENAVRLAERNGYTPAIVRTMQAYGLPPEFFYLALQESNFDTCISGPQTRWGIAKGMWQFIPTTAQAYGLVTGPRVDLRVCDPQDERHDFALATDAAARYLLYIYTHLAHASGLLVMASYNWGEHRVASKLDQLPETPLELVQQDFEGIPENPQQRNYWRFLNEYRDRMPDETKNYVLHIFAAAVIGQNPRLFGFDFDNPLEPYLQDAASSPSAAALPPHP